MAPCFRQLKEERKPFSRRHETFVFPNLLPNTRLLPFQRLFSIPFAAAASHGAKAWACFPLLFCCKSSSSFSSCCSISNSLFIWSGFGILVLCNFYGFFFGEDPLYNRARFLFFYKKAPAPFQQVVHFLDLIAALLVLFPPLLDEQFHYVFPEHFCSASRGSLESPRHEALSRVWRALTALLSWVSPPARTRAFLLLWHFFFRHIQTMRSVGGRNSAGSCASGCIWHGLGLGARIVSFVQQQSLEKATSSPCTSMISVTKIGQRRNLKTAAIHSVAPFQFASLSAPSLVGLATIPCTLPLYFA